MLTAIITICVSNNQTGQSSIVCWTVIGILMFLKTSIHDVKYGILLTLITIQKFTTEIHTIIEQIKQHC
jgi:hypothetical protein